MKDSKKMDRRFIKKGPTIEEIQGALFQPAPPGQGRRKVTFITDKGELEVTVTGCSTEGGSYSQWNFTGVIMSANKNNLKSYTGYYDTASGSGHITIN